MQVERGFGQIGEHSLAAACRAAYETDKIAAWKLLAQLCLWLTLLMQILVELL